MEEQTPMTTDRFLTLLNNASRTPEEESELQAELLRQANEQQAVIEKATTEPAPADVPQAATPAVDQVQPEAPVQEVVEQPVQPDVPAFTHADFVNCMVSAKQAELDYWKAQLG